MTAITTQSVLRPARGMGELPDQDLGKDISGMQAATGRNSSACHAQEGSTRFLLASGNTLSHERIFRSAERLSFNERNRHHPQRNSKAWRLVQLRHSSGMAARQKPDENADYDRPRYRAERVAFCDGLGPAANAFTW
jgi:hypothetical protein